jgi:hypothetical protein
MNDLIKYLIEKIRSKPIGAEALLLFALFAALLGLVQYFETNRVAFAILRNYIFQAGTVFITSTWVASICWRYAKFRTLKIIATSALIVLGIVGSAWIIQSSHINKLLVRIVFDNSLELTPESMTQLLNKLRSPLFDIEISDKAVSINTATQATITDNEARLALMKANLLKSSSESSYRLPILVTARMLEDDEWQNLLMISWSDAVVISVWDVSSNTSLSDTVVNRYVATSVAFETMVSNALRSNKHILEDRPPELYKGCLHDFHRTRQTYILQSQNPNLCEQEEKAMRHIFGGATVRELKSIFNNIAQNAPKPPNE